MRVRSIVQSVAVFAAIAACSNAARAQCRASAPIATCTGSVGRCAPVTDRVSLALHAAADLAVMLDSIGYPNDALSLRRIASDGSLECWLYGLARIDEAVRHVRETGAMHGSPGRVLPVLAALEAASMNLRDALAARVAEAHARGTPPVVFIAGLLDPSMAIFPPEPARPDAATWRWIAVSHGPPVVLPDADRATASTSVRPRRAAPPRDARVEPR